MWKLLLLLILAPVTEIYVLIRIGRATSVWFVVLLVLVSAVVGLMLAKIEGVRVLRRMQRELDEGKLPGDRLLDGVLILVAAVLLIIPGLVTDAFAFLLLFPPTRAVVRYLIKWRIRRRMERGRVRMYEQMGFRPIHDEPPPGFPPLEDEEDR